MSNRVRTWILVSGWYFLFLAPQSSVPMPWWGSKWSEMTLVNELLGIPVSFIMQLFQEFISQSHRTFQRSQNVNISWMMVISISHSSCLSTYALMGLQMYRNLCSFWTILIYRVDDFKTYPNLIGLSYRVRK